MLHLDGSAVDAAQGASASSRRKAVATSRGRGGRGRGRGSRGGGAAPALPVFPMMPLSQLVVAAAAANESANRAPAYQLVMLFLLSVQLKVISRFKRIFCYYSHFLLRCRSC